MLNKHHYTRITGETFLKDLREILKRLTSHQKTTMLLTFVKGAFLSRMTSGKKIYKLVDTHRQTDTHTHG